MSLNDKTLRQSRYGIEPDEWRIEGERGFIDDLERLRHLKKMRADFAAIPGTSKLLMKRIDARIEKLETEQRLMDAHLKMLGESDAAKRWMRQLKKKNGTIEPDAERGVQRTGISKWFPWITF